MPDGTGLTQIFACLYGLAFVAVGISLIADRGLYARLVAEIRDSPAIAVLCGFLAFMIGAVTVALHNEWGGGAAATVITVFGWLSLVEGMFYLAGLAFVPRVLGWFDFLKPPVTNVMGGVIILVGLFLLIAGFQG